MANSGLPETGLHSVAFSPTYATDRTAYLSAEGGQLFRSSDGGLSWVLAHRVPGQPDLAELVVGHQGQVYLASSTGVWRYSSPVRDILINGGFEADSGWDMPETPRPASISSQVVFDGQRSIRVGITEGSNIQTYSSARQVVHIPQGVTTATLSFSVYPASGEAALARQSQFPERDLAFEAATPARIAAGDAQYALILRPDSGASLQTLFWTLSNAQSWQPYQFDLTPYAGQSIRLHFGVFNDGAAGQTGMYVDNVSLLINRPAQAPMDVQLYLPVVHK